MKLKKKSGLMGAVIALSAASLVSVGFASWVISQGDEITATGEIHVDNVDNRIHSIKDESCGWLTALNGTIDNTKNRIVYGASQAAIDDQTGWLRNDGKLQGEEESSLEVLTAWYKIVVENVKSTDKYGEIIASVAFPKPANYDAASTYVGAFPTPKPYVDGVEATATTPMVVDEHGNAEIVYEFAFKWSDTIGQNGPYAYWNAKTVGEGSGYDYATTAARAEAAQEWFEDMDTKISAIGNYTCTITTK